MGLRLFRRIKLFPGVTLNVSKSGVSTSFGVRGARLTVGPKGVRKTVGLPGTGIYYTETTSKGQSRRSTTKQAHSSPTPEEKLDFGFFKKLFTPANEKALVEGLKCLANGDEKAALVHLKDATDLTDGAFLFGILSLKHDHLDDAITFLENALSRQSLLGKHLGKYGIKADIKLPITDEISAYVGPEERGVRLALAEVQQALDQLDDAIENMRALHDMLPDDIVIKVSLSELLFEAHGDDRETMSEIIRLTESISNESNLHAALLLYKARVLRKLGLLDAAKECLKVTLAKKKDRSPEVLKAARYERVFVYEETGQKALGRKELEKIYCDDPNYEDVAKRLGLTY